MPIAHSAARRGELLALAEALVNFETPSGDQARCDALADHIAARFAPLGVVERFANPQGGDHLRVGVAAPAATPDARPALVLCHYDTVWPAGTLAGRPVRVEGDTAYGPGLYDVTYPALTLLGLCSLLPSTSSGRSTRGRLTGGP